MPELSKPIQELLTQLGLSDESVQRFKFGGVVGKVALIGLIGLLSAMGLAKFTQGWPQAVCVVGALVTTLVIIRWVLDYAEKHPDSATLEGSEIIVWRHQEMMMATKGNLSLPSSPVIPAPGSAPPQLNPPEGIDE